MIPAEAKEGLPRRAGLLLALVVAASMFGPQPVFASESFRDLFPTYALIETGLPAGGSHNDLYVDDDSYYKVRPPKSGPRTTSWYASIQGIDLDATSLAVTYRGKASAPCGQVISVFRWMDSTWVQLDARDVSTEEVEVGGLTPPGDVADYLGGTSPTSWEARVRVGCVGSSTFVASGDLLKATVGTPSATQTLTVSKTGDGEGTVTSSPPGITCGANCSHAFPSGTIVDLSATPTGDSVFLGWSGACSGTASCQVTMDESVSVTAAFISLPLLEVFMSGQGEGTVTSTPPGISCPLDCAEAYSSGTVVELSATPDFSATFAGWSGVCTGTGSCQVTVDSSISVTATFDVAAGFPTTVTPENGSIIGGTGSGDPLFAADDVHLGARPPKRGTTASWFATFPGVDNALSSLEVTYEGAATGPCTQTISILRWSDSAWVPLDTRPIGSAAVLITGLAPPGPSADYVSGEAGPGEARVRVSCSGATSSFLLLSDLLRLTLG